MRVNLPRSGVFGSGRIIVPLRAADEGSPVAGILVTLLITQISNMTKKAILLAVVVAGVFAVCSMFASGVSATPVSQHVTVTGYVSCTTCLEPNVCKAQTRAACTEWWVSQGASYVLVAADKHYRLSGSVKEIAKAAFESSVTVTGDLDGTDLTVSSVDFAHKVK